MLDKDAVPADTHVTLKVGARVYGNNDATTFKTVSEGTFEWYRSQMKYTPDLEIPATYDAGSEMTTPGETKQSQIDVASALAPRVAAAGIQPSGALEVSA